MELTFKQRRDRPNVFRAGAYKVVGYLYKWENGSLIPVENYWRAYILKGKKPKSIETVDYTTIEQAVQACQTHSEKE